MSEAKDILKLLERRSGNDRYLREYVIQAALRRQSFAQLVYELEYALAEWGGDESRRQQLIRELKSAEVVELQRQLARMKKWIEYWRKRARSGRIPISPDGLQQIVLKAEELWKKDVGRRYVPRHVVHVIYCALKAVWRTHDPELSEWPYSDFEEFARARERYRKQLCKRRKKSCASPS